MSMRDVLWKMILGYPVKLGRKAAPWFRTQKGSCRRNKERVRDLKRFGWVHKM